MRARTVESQPVQVSTPRLRPNFARRLAVPGEAKTCNDLETKVSNTAVALALYLTGAGSTFAPLERLRMVLMAVFSISGDILRFSKEAAIAEAVSLRTALRHCGRSLDRTSDHPLLGEPSALGSALHDALEHRGTTGQAEGGEIDDVMQDDAEALRALRAAAFILTLQGKYALKTPSDGTESFLLQYLPHVRGLATSSRGAVLLPFDSSTGAVSPKGNRAVIVYLGDDLAYHVVDDVDTAHALAHDYIQRWWRNNETGVTPTILYSAGDLSQTCLVPLHRQETEVCTIINIG